MPFKLFAQFPNRNFDIGDERRSLLDLKLCPSGTLIMKPIKNAASAYNKATNVKSTTSSWFNYVSSAGNMIYDSASSAMSFLVTPATHAPEPGQRLGESSTPRNNINTLNSVRDKKKDNDKQTYNGNSINQE